MQSIVTLGRLEARLEDTRKIAVLRANGIGDYLFAEPALTSLAEAYPDAELVLIGAPWHEAELAGRPGPVRRVIVAPPSPGIREPSGAEGGYADVQELGDFFGAMRAERFDLAVQLHGGGRNSNPFVQRLGARLAVGSHTPDAVQLDRSIPYYYFRHEVLRFLEIAGLAGAPPARLTPFWPVTTMDRDRAEESLGVALSALAPYVVLSPGAGDPRRRWPAEQFSAVADWLAEQGLACLIVGSAEDAPLASRVQMSARSKVTDVSGRLTLGALGAVMQAAQVAIANDSGPLHLARAAGTPTTGIYWCGNVINAAPVASADHQLAISWRLECPECGANCLAHECGHTASFVADVTASEVQDRTAELLRRRQRAGTKLT